MSDWNPAHKAAALYFAHSVGWSILGLALIWHGFVVSSPLSLFVMIRSGQFSLGLFEVVFGLAVFGLGNAISFFNAKTNLMENEVGRRDYSEVAPELRLKQ